ncbi:MAG TPA: serine/threonine-protein kinase [Polyangia bacterium]|jgi:hypothetical protein|nr:serine/threonine-protein kinase [Polyangia bacterium]
MPPFSGVRFGRYRLIEQIGQGGMGVVHRAIIDGPRGFSRDIVIKRLLPELSRDAGFVDMLATEAQLCARLRHPGIVHVHEFGEIDGEFYLSMELVEGDSLLNVLKDFAAAKKMLPVGVVCYIVAELAAALGYAHGLTNDGGQPLQIVHRDVTPSNVMLTRAGGVKLLDFGIAKAATHIGKDETRSGTLRGKLSYMSPEQAEGLRIDHRTDIFALGVIFWECLTLERLFKGATDFETLRLIRQPHVAPPSTLVDGLDRDIDGVVLKMLAHELGDRYASCEDVAAALAPIVHRLHGDASGVRALVADLKPRVRPAPTLPALDDPSATPVAGANAGDDAATRAEPEPRAFAREARRRRVVIAGLASAIAAIAIVALTLRHPSRTATTAASVTTAATETPPAATADSATADSATTPTVHLHFRGTPNADVFVDRADVGKVPLDLELPRANRMHQLVIRRRGFVTLNRVVSTRSDVTLDVALERLPPPASLTAKRKSPPPAPDGPRIRDPFHSP